MGNTLTSAQRAHRRQVNDRLLQEGKYKCSKCLKVKPIIEFSPYGKKWSAKPYSQCKECTRNRINKRNRQKAEKRRSEYTDRCQLCDVSIRANRNTQKFCNKTHRIFAWQVAQYKGDLNKARELFRINYCEACGSPDNLCIDHDHKTGQVRGRLCSTCNSSLGHFFESTKSMREAIEYLGHNLLIPTLSVVDDRSKCRWCETELINSHPNRKFCSRLCKHRAGDVFEKYHLTVEQYKWLIDIQQNKCTVCKTTLTNSVVDHDHRTNRVRGLLCWHCNLAIGHVQDDISILSNLIEYLERYKSTYDDWSVRTIDNKLVRQIARERHYLHRNPNVSYGFGLYQKDQLMGICSFGTPSSMRITNSVCPSDPKSVIELNRLWIDDSCPKNTASWFVSRCLKELPPYIVISYADTGVLDDYHGRYHDGTIYRALNFFYSGRSKRSVDWRIPGKTRNVGKSVEGSVRVEVPPKNRYWTLTGTKRDKRYLDSICNWKKMDYISQSVG